MTGLRARPTSAGFRRRTRFSIPRLATIRRLDLATLRAAWWTQGALRRTRRTLRTRPIGDVVVGRPPPLPAHAGRGVYAVLRRVPATCLERALVLQRWLSEQGSAKDVVIGVTGAQDFRAHAWLDGETVDEQFQELTRLRPPAG
jgi:hypothetical protein